MVNLEQKLQTQRENIAKGGWKKYWAYLVLGALVCLAVAYGLFSKYLLRNQLAEARTERDVAEEKLIQDEVNDQIEDLEKIKEEAAQLNEEEETKRFRLDRTRQAVNAQHKTDAGVIDSLVDWDDVDEKVEWGND